MGKTKSESHDCEGEPGEGAERNPVKVFVDEKTKEKATPKYFLQERHNQNKSKKTQTNGGPIDRGTVGKNGRIKTDHPRGKSEKGLRRNPEAKDKDPHGNSEDSSPRWFETIFAPEPEHDSAAENYLRRINPIFRRGHPERPANLLQSVFQRE